MRLPGRILLKKRQLPVARHATPLIVRTAVAGAGGGGSEHDMAGRYTSGTQPPAADGRFTIQLEETMNTHFIFSLVLVAFAFFMCFKFRKNKEK